MKADEAMRRLAEVIRRKHFALATERSYCAWPRRYCDRLKRLTFHLPGEQKPEWFLTGLAMKNAAASAHNQNFYGIIFLLLRRFQWI